MNRLLDDIVMDEEAGTLFTKALTALEAFNYSDCLETCILALEHSWSIEQRLGILFLMQLAESKDETRIKEALNQAYDYKE